MARLRSVPEPPARESADLRVAVRDAIAGMPWLKPSDQAAVALARRFAEQIEEVADRLDLLRELQGDVGGDLALQKRLAKLEGMCEVAKTVGWLGPQLQAVLRDLAGTPTGRKQLDVAKPVGGRLKQLREDAAKRRA